MIDLLSGFLCCRDWGVSGPRRRAVGDEHKHEFTDEGSPGRPDYVCKTCGKELTDTVHEGLEPTPNTPEATDRLLCEKLLRNTTDWTAFCPEPVYRNPDGPAAVEYITALKAENARLREALRQVAFETHETIPPDGEEAAFGTLAAIAKIAVAALRQPQAGGHDER